MDNYENKTKENDEKEVDEVDIEKYKDVEGISTKKLNLGLWLVENKRKFFISLKVFLIILAVISWTYTIYSFTYYISKGMKEDEILVKQLIQTKTIGHEFIVSRAAQDLIITPPKVLKYSGNKYDIFAQVENPNAKHWSSFSYCFLNNGEEIDCANNFIFPNEEKYLLSFSQEFSSQPTNVQLIIKSIAWARIRAQTYPDWEEFSKDHLNFKIKDIKFEPVTQSSTISDLDMNLLEFTATNNTAYNYWEAIFNILLFRGSSIIGVNRYTLAEFMSGETRDIKISWPGKIGNVNNTQIFPEINIIRDDIYIQYEGGVGEEK